MHNVFVREFDNENLMKNFSLPLDDEATLLCEKIDSGRLMIMNF